MQRIDDIPEVAATTSIATRPWYLQSLAGVIGTALLTLILLAAAFGVLWTPYDPIAVDFHDRFASSSFAHWLGTDQWGRDVLSRLLVGATTSVYVSLATVFFAVCFGTVIGSLAGFFGGWVDRGVSAVIDAWLAFPGILLALAIMAIAGPSKSGLVLALGIAYTPKFARLVRGTVYNVRAKEFVEASRALGNGALYTLARHVIPNCVAPLIVMATARFGSALLAESALSFLGLGVPPPAPTWGNMLAEARDNFIDSPLLAVYPGLCITLALLAINLFGDALRDRLDPRMQH